MNMNTMLLSVQLAAVILFMHLWFVYAVLRRRNDIADVAWGLGFVLLAAIGLVYAFNSKTLVVFILVAFWGVRLSTHIYARFRRHAEEDRRYQKMREKWGRRQAFYSWWNVFVGQGFFMVLVAAPVIALPHYGTAEWSTVHFVGIALWVFGYAFESVSDMQLARFLADGTRRQGERIMQRGLWRFSRHPNYFGEATLWWGMWLITLGPVWPYTLLGPVTITWLLRFVSGVPLAEAGFAGDPAFEEYKRRTPAFFPNPFVRRGA